MSTYPTTRHAAHKLPRPSGWHGMLEGDGSARPDDSTDGTASTDTMMASPEATLPDDPDLLEERLRVAFNSAGLGSYAHLVLVPLTTIVLWSSAPRPLLVGWSVVVLAMAIARWATARHFKRLPEGIAPDSLGKWRVWLIVSTAVFGAAWGSVALLFFADVDQAVHLYMTLVIGGLVLGAVAVTTHYQPAFFAFFLPAAVPLVVLHLAQGQQLYVIIGLLLVVFCIVISALAVAIGNAFLDQIRLQHARDHLRGRLEEVHRTLNYALQSRSESFAIFDPDDRLVIWNERFADRFEPVTGTLKIGVPFETLVAGIAPHRIDPDTGEPDARWPVERLERHRNPRGTFEQNIGDSWVLINEIRTPDGFTLVMHTDISELKQREQDLKESEARKAGIVNAALDAIITIDADGRIMEFNRAAERMFGYAAEQIAGRLLSDTLFPPSVDSFRLPQRDGAGGRHPDGPSPIGRRIEGRAQRADGTILPVEMALTQVHLSTGDLFSLYVRDISERRAAERQLMQARDEAEAASRTKSDFLATMSHEIRTPMNGVLGAVELLLETRLGKRQSQFARMAQEAGEALRLLLDDLLDLSQIEAGRVTLEAEPFDLARLVDSVLDIAAPDAAAKDVTITAELDPALPAKLVGDRARLRQVLLNLVSNAVKFTDEGSVRVTARAIDRDDGPAVRLEVADTGIGIADTAQDAIFERFVQADPGPTRRHGGAGLGLAITKHLVDLMNGRIGVESNLGKGSLFWVELAFPAGRERARATAPADQPVAAAQWRLSGKRILVVDDSEVNRMVTTAMLKKAGADVADAASGPQAVAAIQRQPTDLVLMDISMPHMDGFETTRHIRALGAEFEAIPVVALTAHVREEDRQQVLEAELNGYVCKPIRREDLFTVISDLMAPPSVPVIDWARLDTLRSDLGPAGQAQLVRAFMEEVADMCHDLPRHIADGALEPLMVKAHALKSAAKSFGAAALGQAGEVLEKTLEEHLKSGGGSTASDPLYRAAHRFQRQARTTLAALAARY